MPHPTPETLRKRGLVNVNAETVTNVSSSDFPGHYPGEDHAWDLDYFRHNLRVQFHKNQTHDAVFSIVGVDASIANAFRRILLSELPTLAIETVFIENNTSVIQDEVLAHRLGLVPLKASKEGLRWLKWKRKASEEDPTTASPSLDNNTVVLKLEVECSWKKDGMQKLRQGITDPKELYDDAHIYASHLHFDPNGRQKTQYFNADSGPVEPVSPDILIAKLRPGQKIILSAYAELGVGADHAKFSPVATASYRLLPVIDIQKPILGDDAVKFQSCFPQGVIGLDKVTRKEAKQVGSGYEGHEGEQKAVVKEAIRDTVTRECLRHEEFRDKVKLGRQRDHFIFSVESTGQWDSDELFVDSVKMLKRKCMRIKRDFAQVREQG